MSYVLRRARLRDLPAIVNIMRHGFPHWYLRIPYLASTTFVVETNDTVCGFVAVPMHKGVGEIGAIAISQGYQGSGLGSLLLNDALLYLKQKGASSCLAKVRLNNKPAERLFTKANFSVKKVLRRRILGDVISMERSPTGRNDINATERQPR